MGAFHEGHLSLMRAARTECDHVVVSLFVNPTQFGEAADFIAYPRDEARDFHLAECEGVDVVFAPSSDAMFPRHTTSISVSGVSERWEGASRPGHFEGVATVVAKLFHLVRPDFAYFGLKDLQQCAVVQRMVEDLNIPVTLRFCEIVREPDGLAMSSRNVRLTGEERARAPELFRTLSWVAESARESRSSDVNTTFLKQLCELAKERLAVAGLTPDYVAVVEQTTMVEAESIDETCRVIGAARLGPVRLIDNVPVATGEADH